MRTLANPERCPSCQSRDTWKWTRTHGLIASVAKSFGRQLLTCRSCGNLFYTRVGKQLPILAKMLVEIGFEPEPGVQMKRRALLPPLRPGTIPSTEMTLEANGEAMGPHRADPPAPIESAAFRSGSIGGDPGQSSNGRHTTDWQTGMQVVSAEQPVTIPVTQDMGRGAVIQNSGSAEVSGAHSSQTTLDSSLGVGPARSIAPLAATFAEAIPSPASAQAECETREFSMGVVAQAEAEIEPPKAERKLPQNVRAWQDQAWEVSDWEGNLWSSSDSAAASGGSTGAHASGDRRRAS